MPAMASAESLSTPPAGSGGGAAAEEATGGGGDGGGSDFKRGHRHSKSLGFVSQDRDKVESAAEQHDGAKNENHRQHHRHQHSVVIDLLTARFIVFITLCADG